MLLPNVRGSDGYGKAYLAMDDGVKREEALGDIGATLDWIASRPDLDPAPRGRLRRHRTVGTWCSPPPRSTRRASARAVDVVGHLQPPHLPRVHRAVPARPAPRRVRRRARPGRAGRPGAHLAPQQRRRASPRALYVIQGKNDPRVPQSEAEQIVAAVQGKGKDVWYLLALDEGHGFQKKENRDYLIVTTVAFLERTLLP